MIGPRVHSEDSIPPENGNEKSRRPWRGMNERRGCHTMKFVSVSWHSISLTSRRAATKDDSCQVERGNQMGKG